MRKYSLGGGGGGGRVVYKGIIGELATCQIYKISLLATRRILIIVTLFTYPLL